MIIYFTSNLKCFSYFS